MDLNQATELVASWRYELANAQEALANVQAQVAGLQRLIEGVEMMFPDLKPSIWDEQTTAREPAARVTPTAVVEPSPKVSIKATEGVRKILADNPTTWFSG